MKVNTISIVLPVHNQADHIMALIEEYFDICRNIPAQFEYILVVNNCRDHSLEICQALAETDPRVRVIHSQRGGWGLSVRKGIQEAGGELICYTNSARTKPKDLLLFLLYALANPEVVIKANRKFHENWRRRLGSLIYNLEVRLLFDLPYWDINGTPKIFPRKFHKLLGLNEDGDLIDAEFGHICRQENYPVLEVPIVSIGRRGGESTTNYYSAIVMYWGAVQMWRKLYKSRR